MTLYRDRKAMNAAIWREDLKPWLLDMAVHFLTTFVRGCGYAAALLIAVLAYKALR